MSDLQNSSGRISWLDGWRTIAVGIVIVSHLRIVYRWEGGFVPGKLGVFIFFLISGYIVTRTIVRERQRIGQIDVWRFLARRALRILPPLVLYVAACAALFPEAIDWKDVVRALAFTCNMDIEVRNCGWLFVHTWSLGFEEQFYLVLATGLAAWQRPAALAAFLVVLAIAAIPFFLPFFYIGRIGFVQIYLLLGLGLLYALFEDRLSPIMHRVPATVAIVLLALVWTWFLLPPGPMQKFSGLVVPVCIMVSIFSLPKRSRLVERLLSSRPMTTIGLWSYTLYLWQQLATTQADWNTGMMPILGICGAIAISALSYYTVEAWCRGLAASRLRPVKMA